MPRKRTSKASRIGVPYDGLVGDIAEILSAARRASARAVNALMTATYWEIGRRIVEFEQGGAERAEYGERLIERLSHDLSARFGRGFGQRNLETMRQFHLAFPSPFIATRLAARGWQQIPQTVSAESGTQLTNPQTLSAESSREKSSTLSNKFQTASGIHSSSGESSAPPPRLDELARALPLPWSQYVLLIRRARSPEALEFYHTEALRGGWSVRQLQRQIESQFYERT